MASYGVSSHSSSRIARGGLLWIARAYHYYIEMQGRSDTQMRGGTAGEEEAFTPEAQG